jgi:ABC-type bacteriocin/lantibiotic exporter with double-glycine peptidase domain
LENGAVTLSGGQKAAYLHCTLLLIKEPQIMVFDDASAPFDAKTENQIINNLYSVLGDKTAISHHAQNFHVLNFDQVIILMKAKSYEQGTHEEIACR